jgi:hypothetical protein
MNTLLYNTIQSEMNIVKNSHISRHIYLFINLINYVKISDFVKLLRCNKQLYEQIYVIYKHIQYH